MRAGLNTIQQTLTPEAANVLNLSIAEAGRRNHGQTTPLHVAATLLSSPSGYLRQACIRSHPNSSHPLQCRALELCFSVALERLPTSQSIGPGMEPPISNALMAALKRAQAHQRRGCPEQQQQPLLAVKVELEQLIISILDDPSVSRVMREASFSSPAVKATIEQVLNSQPPSVHPSPMGIGFRPSPTPMPVPARNLYLNPRLQQGNLNSNSLQSGVPRIDEIKRITDILLRTKKSNPVLVGDSEPDLLIKELLRKIERGELGESPLKSVQVIPLEKEFASDKVQIPAKLKELGGLIEAKMGTSNGGGIILDLGDLKWLVEQPGTGGGATAQQVAPEMGRAAVEEMGKLLSRFRDGGSCKLWLIGTATCETYLRCQVYHPSMESDWDLQVVPIASRSPIPGMFPRFGSNGILGSSVESLSPLKGFPPMTTVPARRLLGENLDPARRIRCCPQCTESYEKELAKSVAEEKEKSSSDLKSEAARPALPQWLQNAKVLNGDAKASSDQSQNKEQDVLNKQELQKKWTDNCLRLHPSFHRSQAPPTLSMSNLYNPKLLSCQPFPQKLQQNKNHGESLRLNSNPVTNQSTSPPGSPVRTDLALGPKKATEMGNKDLLGCITSEKFADPDAFKKLLKGLLEKVWWQQDAASAVAATVTKCRLGNGRRRGSGIKGDMWLLFTGPDRVGKKKMAAVLSEQICGASPVTICLGSDRRDEELETKFRGKTVLDRIVEAVRRNPFSVIMLQDIDEADMIVRGNIKRAMDRGRLSDSHGREISLGNVIFILTSDWLPENLNKPDSTRVLDEKKLESIASGGWQLRVSVGEKSGKRRANWLLHDEGRATKPRMETGFDLNLAADTDEDRGDGSNNCSDLTVDHEDENMQFPITTIPRELVSFMDDGIVIFKPVQLAPVRNKVRTTIAEKFSAVVEEKVSIEFEEEALEKILAGVWLGRAGLEEWSEKVLIPSFQQLKQHLPSDDGVVVRLECGDESGSRSSGDWLPSAVSVRVGV